MFSLQRTRENLVMLQKKDSEKPKHEKLMLKHELAGLNARAGSGVIACSILFLFPVTNSQIMQSCKKQTFL